MVWVFGVPDLKFVSFVIMVLNNIDLIREYCGMSRVWGGFWVDVNLVGVC